MYHVGLPQEHKGKPINYSALRSDWLNEGEQPPENLTNEFKSDEDLPKPPPGFLYHRVKGGESLVSIAVKYNVSEGKIRRLNKAVCFGNRLSHLENRVLIIPISNDAKMTPEIEQMLSQAQIDASNQTLGEPSEDAKYKLLKVISKFRIFLSINFAISQLFLFG